MSRKKSGQATRSAKPKRRLRKLFVLALLGGIATAVAKKLGGSAPAVTAPPAAPRPTAAPATPAPTDATEPAVEDVAPKKPAPNKSDPTEPPTDEAAIERLETEAPVETPAPAEVVTDESLENTSENPAIPADSLTSFFDEVLTENEQAKNTRKR